MTTEAITHVPSPPEANNPHQKHDQLFIPIMAQDVSWILWKSELAREASKPLRQTLTTFAAQGERNGEKCQLVE